MSTPARFASSLCTEADSEVALRTGLDELRRGLAGARPDLVFAFVSHHHGAAIELLGPRLVRELDAPHVLGCTGQGIVGAEHEVERGPALALWAAVLPRTTVRALETGVSRDAAGVFSFSAMPTVDDPTRASLLVVADPFTFPMSDYLEELNAALPGVPAIGGMASGGSGPGQNLLFTQHGVVEGGAIGVVVEGAIEVRTIVSQGCRPVGKPLVITACRRNILQRLGGRTAIEALIETFTSLTPVDRDMLQSQPFIGLALDARKQSFERGDFLVRGIVGADNKVGALAVGDGTIRLGQTVQFLVRDAGSATEDLTQLVRSRSGGPPADPSSVGALLFSCNGRGTRMFTTPDHDIGCVRDGLEATIPTAGFFAMGEVGPVGGRNFLHGFTASVALFRERADESSDLRRR